MFDEIMRCLSNFEYDHRRAGRLDDETRAFIEDLTRLVVEYQNAYNDDELERSL